MITWILVLNVYAGVFVDGDSLSLTNIPGFISQQECTDAGKASSALATGKKEINFICLKQTKEDKDGNS